MGMRRRLRLGIAAVLVSGLAIGRVVEMQRLAVPLPRDSASPAQGRLDAERMLLDLQVLASPRFQGRGPDTPGGMLAAQVVVSRFTELGLTPFGNTFERPFTFTHRSVRALWRRNRPFSKTFTLTKNVVGYVPGTTHPEAFIVVSAHFDHLGIIGGAVHPGADDNASGTAALLAMAAYVKAHPLAHSVVFAAFDAEELGRRGSRAFVEALPFDREHLVLDVNVDMIGRSDAGRLFVSGVRYTPSLLPVVQHAANGSRVPVHVGHDRPMYLTGLIDDWTHASDHGSFHDVGVPFLYFGVEDHDDMHQPTDTAERIDQPFFTNAAETVLSTLLTADTTLP